jgi:2,4-dienoyl-CoA reductase (NADPH2)
VLFEREHKIGGLIPVAALVSDLELTNLVALVRYFQLQIAKLGVTIRSGIEVTASTIEKLKPDVVILAAGGKPGAIEIRGINGRNVVSSTTLHRRLRLYRRLLGPKALGWLTKLWMPIGKRVVVVGGAIQGCELAEFLIKRNRTVTIVDTGEVLGEGMTQDNKRRLFRWLDEKDVLRLTGVKYEEITDKGLVIRTKEGQRTILEADTVALIVPLQPNTDLVKRLAREAPEIHPVGDCREPHLIADAIADGWQIGCSI